MINFLKKNWIVAILILIIVFLSKDKVIPVNKSQIYPEYASTSEGLSVGKVALDPSANYSRSEAAPVDTQDRLVIKDTSMSLLVKNVSESITKVEEIAKSAGGFLVNSYLSKPGESTNGNISVRVPESKRSEILSSFKGLAVKVISESVSGNDVTDEYVDLEARLAVLNKTKVKFEEIMDKAYVVNDLLNVQRELINLQSQIDSLKGQQKYYEQSAKLSKIIVYLSTDELALPYAPDNSWRPAVVFKTAVRSLVQNLRSFANLAIWTIVYAPILIPAVILFFFLKRKLKI